MSITNEDSKDELSSNIVRDTLPTYLMYCHNLDFSTFPFLCEMVHRHITDLKYKMDQPIDLPFATFQHCMTVLLNMQLIKYKYDKHVDVPRPIAEYLNDINTITVLTEDKVQVNIPEIAIPQFTVPKEENKAEIPPGSFGRLTAENHNVYECYVSPYITRRLVEQTRERKVGPWNPLPNGAYPPGTVPNKNLLGYAKPEELTPESVSILKKYDFPNTNDMIGRLQIEPQLMHDVATTLHDLRAVYESVPFHTIQRKSTQKSQNLLGVTRVSTLPFNMCTHNVQLSELGGDIFSPCPLKSTSVKTSMLYGLKRLRTIAVPGFCYTKRGQAPDDWEYFINHNFNMEGPFQTTKYPDYPHLRDEYHIATFPKGDKINFISDWITSYNLQ